MTATAAVTAAPGAAGGDDLAAELDAVSAWFGTRQVLADVSMRVPERSVTALIGPSGSGKSTLLRCVNRLHELVVGARLEGRVCVAGSDVYARGVDAVDVRRRVGMVFQRPNPFPHMSIYDNVVAGLRLNGIHGPRAQLDEIVERSLQDAGLWGEVKDRLRSGAGRLSGGQQQRLCIARAVALQPDVLLMDEPASALDPQSTQRIEELIGRLREEYAIVIVTHNMQQAARVAQHTAFLTTLEEGGPARLVEFGPTREIFANARHERTRDYVAGRFG
jgi:phosphate transport system ATP-binding protein